MLQQQRQQQQKWFETTFTQLPDVCQKQLGALVGALVADAAVKGIDLDSVPASEAAEAAASLALFPTSVDLFEQDYMSKRGRGGEGDDRRSSFAASSSSSHSPLSLSSNLFRTLSPSSVAAIDVVDAIDASKSVDARVWQGAVSAAVLRALEVSTASAVGQEQTSLLHPPANFSLFPLCAAVPIVTLYPFARDSDVHENMSGLIAAVAERDDDARNSGLPRQLICPPMIANGDGDHEADGGVSQAAAAAAVIEHYLAGASVLLRCVQSNPDAAANAMLRLRGQQCGFKFIPEHIPALLQRQNGGDDSSSSSEYCWKNSNDVLVSAWSILRSERHLLLKSGSSAHAEKRGRVALTGSAATTTDFERVIRKCIRETVRRKPALMSGGSAGATATQLAAYVGACAGAQAGVRNIPVEWMAACDERTEGALSRAINSAVGLSQWIWNPPQ